MADATELLARAKKRHARNTNGECTECSQGHEFGGEAWPCATWLDLETDEERAERESTQRQAERAAAVAQLAKHYRLQSKGVDDALRRREDLLKERARTATELVGLLDGDTARAAELLGTTETHIRNHQADAAGVLYGMAEPSGWSR